MGILQVDDSGIYFNWFRFTFIVKIENKYTWAAGSPANLHTSTTNWTSSSDINTILRD